MEVLLLVGAIVILGIWTGWQEYRLNKIREELDYNSSLLVGSSHIDTVRKNSVFYRLGVIERKLRAKETQERIEHRKAEMKEYLGEYATDNDIDKLYAMAIGLQESVNKCKEED